MKLWQKETEINSLIEKFTIGKDQIFDLELAEFDVLGSIAHIKMLASVGLIPNNELPELQKELCAIYQNIKEGKFEIEAGVEDVHSQIELLLTRKLGEAGKKIHSGRSRNDQVLVDLKLFIRNRIQDLVADVEKLFLTFIKLSEAHKDKMLPGYTHLQIAMPSSFGLWFGAYAESLIDDLVVLQSAYKVANQNPLGSGAGYGSSLPLNRTMTTHELGFDDMNRNVVYAQMSRGKSEYITACALTNIAHTLSRFAMDTCLYINQNFSFISLPDSLTTGSSIMPHKKNPDVFELIRAKCNKIKALPTEISLLTTNLPSGYHRDLQILKENFFPSFQEISSCIEICAFMLENIQVKSNILEDSKYQYLFSVERVNDLVLEGVPFREAYKKVGEEIEKGNFFYNKTLNHTHEGSLGNLGNDILVEKFKATISNFGFAKAKAAEKRLLTL